MPAKTCKRTANGRNRPIWCSTTINQTPLPTLQLYANAVRLHTEAGLLRLAESIAEFGFVVPVLIDGDNIVIAGHGRVEAAKRLKMRAIPTIRADHLSAAQIKAYRIADNKLADLSA
ncbi:ParB/Srx family N-terminal domain-containing protein [Shimia sp. R9_3]|uniref:ParB/Srx family N-terminal domain-containing protein n=1 Tax=Shimia sp. R9_3 TaxID=2821113 RepID=UPI001ADAEA76|nr:ParB/Srx family N-terminal domain-containing protein [Shimia sp. R9_3]MBO9400929.1 ParB N-terminal domain-containing protein [Shimia sp. R9_3]